MACRCFSWLCCGSYSPVTDLVPCVCVRLSPLQVLLSLLREKWAGHPQTKLLIGTARQRCEHCPLVEAQAFHPPWRDEWKTKMSIT